MNNKVFMHQRFEVALFAVLPIPFTFFLPLLYVMHICLIIAIIHHLKFFFFAKYKTMISLFNNKIDIRQNWRLSFLKNLFVIEMALM